MQFVCVVVIFVEEKMPQDGQSWLFYKYLIADKTPLLKVAN